MLVILYILNVSWLIQINKHTAQKSCRLLHPSCVIHSGTEMMDGQLMGEFEAEAKDMEADSWSLGVEQQYLQQLDRELVKRQDVIYGTF